MRPVIYFLLLISYTLTCCRSSSLTTTWKPAVWHNANYHSILVFGIVEDDDTLLRSEVEQALSKGLQASGYRAVSALRAFGENGLSDLGQEQTLLALCNKGFDAVLTVAAIDRSMKERSAGARSYEHAANYYLDRIWNYEKVLADFSDTTPARNAGYFWETIFFDLYTLEPRCTIQSGSYQIKNEVSFGLARALVAKLKKEKILKNLPANARQWAAGAR